MIAIDTNILVYAYREDSPFHSKANAALLRVARGALPWALPWPCVHEFLAVVTSRRVYVPATPTELALAQMQTLADLPNCVLIAETDTHWGKLCACVDANVIGRKIHDAKIAAICIQHGVREFWSADRDFSRFPQLKTVNPLI